jgi:hypothetical protein
MRSTPLALALGLTLGWMLAARAQVLPTPTPTPGTGRVAIDGAITVAGGTIDIGNTPTVNARQNGEWRVTVSETPAVRLRTPQFLKVNEPYRFVWSAQELCECRVLEVLDGGWLKVTPSSGPPRWINAALAIRIEPL